MTNSSGAAFLGFIEGLTEFIPVSSTGHLVIFADLIGFSSPGHLFEVFIQLGAILAVVVFYRRKILDTVTGLPGDRTAQKFALNIIVATIPAVLAGVAAHRVIKGLYTPPVIGAALVIGGILILLIERRFSRGRIGSIDDIPLRVAFLIGLFQVLALVPGVSRSGATIMGALILGLDRKCAAEFSFFLAIPIICGAVLFDTVKNFDAVAHPDGLGLLLTGFVVAFVTSLLVLKAALGVISRKGFAPFAWYRIVAGALVLVFLR